MAVKTRKALNVSCPECHDVDGRVMLDLNNLDICVCEGCGAEFSPAEAAEAFAAELHRWIAVQNWIDTAPTK